MWRTILRPDVLFTIATLQALSPYVFWVFGVGEFKGHANLTYLPVVVWTAGWIAFMLGSVLVRDQVTTPLFQVAPSKTRIQLATLLVIAVICVQLASLAKLYGGIPILSYLRRDGAMNIGTAVALQDESGVGQVGSVYITTALLHGLVLLLIICNLERNRKDRFLLLLAAVALLAAHSINGKRQGFFRCAVFLFTGMALYARQPVAAFAQTIPFLRRKWFAGLVSAGVAGLLFFSFGYLAYVRNQGQYERSSLKEVITYQEYALVNFEIQCAASGLGPNRTDFVLWLRRLVPWKLMDSLGLADEEVPARYEPWAPAGLFEDVKWCLGIGGVLAYAFVLGLVTMACYRRALSSPFYLLAYCQISFSLMISHSFNEFISLSWIPGPVFLFWILSRFLRRSRGAVPALDGLREIATA